MPTDRGVWLIADALTGVELADLGRRIEELGYSTFWLGETTGRDPFAQTAHLGAVTTTLVLASGIANVYNRHPGVMWQGACDFSQDNFFWGSDRNFYQIWWRLFFRY